MCGLAGFVRQGGLEPEDTVALRSVTDALAHRGPDDAGYWTNATAGIALGHRRLSIIDLSPAGHQPMLSACKRYALVFNGEIYNHQELRRALEKEGGAPEWRGHSDTEVLLAALAFWGVSKTLEGCTGMFAFALWDNEERSLTLARDRMGEKPLYYGWQGERFVFASELASFKALPAWRDDIDRGALALMMRHNCIPAPYSIYHNVRKLRPGHFLVLHYGQEEPEVRAYWDILGVASRGFSRPFEGSCEEAANEVERLLRTSLQGQMIADVPLGCFLSGGVDSSLIVALMQSMNTHPVRTFSIGFEEAGYNESTYAAAVAKHIGTAHTELFVTGEEAREVVPRLPDIYSEPFSDSSQIPTYLVAKLAREQVTVSLSGDGGDELFSGYTRYALTDRLWKKLSLIPAPLRALVARGIKGVSPGMLSKLLDPAAALLPQRHHYSNAGDLLHKIADVLPLQDHTDLYRALTSHWTDPEELVLKSREPRTLLTGERTLPAFPTAVQRMMLLDQMTYLPDDILVKVDRAGMAASLESRVPFLDHRLVSFAASLPLEISRHDGQSKWPLRHILDRYVPRTLIERPKTGFGIPLDGWLRGPLRDWAETLLDTKKLKEGGFFNAKLVQKVWREHLCGSHNQAYRLWDVLMFQAWLDRD
jgi:asparagine synthase (glutamine-hydrolysing)